MDTMSRDLEQLSLADVARRQSRLAALMLGSPATAYPEFKNLLQVARNLTNKNQETLALLNLAGCAFLTGDYPDMLSLSYQALDLCRSARLTNHEPRALNSIGLALHRLGELDTSMRYFMDSLRLANQRLDNTATARALGNIALVHMTLAEHDVALRYHNQALQLLRVEGNVVGIVNMLCGSMADHYQLGNYAETLRLAPQTIRLALHHNLARYECDAKSSLARTLLALGRATTAKHVARAAQRVAHGSGDLEAQGQLSFIEGSAAFELDETEHAEHCFLQSTEAAEKLGHKEHAIEAHRELAKLYHQIGQPKKAKQHHDRATTLGALVFDPSVTERTQALAHELSTDRNLHASHSWSLELAELTKSLSQKHAELTQHADQPTALNSSTFTSHAQEIVDTMSPGEVAGLAAIEVHTPAAWRTAEAHTVGAQVVQRLNASVRMGDLVGYQIADSGRCTVLLHLSHLARPTDVQTVVGRCTESLTQPLTEIELDVTTSHSAIVPLDGTSVTALLESTTN